MKANGIILAITSMLFISCNEKTNTSTTETNPTVKTNTKEIGSCFEKYQEDYSKLLTLEDIKKHVKIDNEVKTDELKYRKLHQSYEYKWFDGRMQEIKTGGMTLTVEDPNYVKLSNVKIREGKSEEILEKFDIQYRKLGDKELQKMKANIENHYKDKPKEKETAIGFLETRNNMIFTEVKGLGTKAYWKEISKTNNYGVELYVLYDNVEFKIDTKTTNDNAVNSQTAIALAKEILSKCN